MADAEDVQQRTLDVLEEILKWTRVTSIPQVKKTLEEMLASDEQIRAYNHSTGNSSRKVAELSGVAYGTVSAWWKTWFRAGLGEMQSVRRGDRFVRSFDLEDFGITIPPRAGQRTRRHEKSRA